MSLPRLCTRVAHLEARRARTAPQPILLVPLYPGETHEAACQAAGYAPEEVSGRLVVFTRRYWWRREETPTQAGGLPYA